MWICEKCNEENEDNFDACWKCYDGSERQKEDLEAEKKEEEKKEQEKVEKKANKDVWICEKCNEENEDSFESCWKCQTESDIGLKKSKIYHTLLNDENKKEYEEKKKESLIYEKVNKFTLKDILSLSMDFYS